MLHKNLPSIWAPSLSIQQNKKKWFNCQSLQDNIFYLLSNWCSNGTALAAIKQIAIVTNLSILKLFLLADLEIFPDSSSNFTCLAGHTVSLYIHFSETIKPDICRIRSHYCICEVIKVELSKKCSLSCKQLAFVYILCSYILMQVLQHTVALYVCTTSIERTVVYDTYNSTLYSYTSIFIYTYILLQ